MESTGKAGRIQISQTTATLLKAAGRGSWFTEREDRIHAKGKGELTTYWLHPSDRAGSVASGMLGPGSSADYRSAASTNSDGSEMEFASNNLLHLEQALKQRIGQDVPEQSPSQPAKQVAETTIVTEVEV